MKDDKQWDRVIKPRSSYLIMGDIGTGKSALAYWLLETFSQKYGLLPVVVGFPRDKQTLLPSNFIILEHPSECARMENAIVFIDEADLQLPIEDIKARDYVVNFLSLPRHRHQIFLLAFHFPRLVMGRYLPFFSAFLLKRPPYLIELASKSKGDILGKMMERAEESFVKLPEANVVKHTYVVAPRIRWQGLLQNPLCSFWGEDLSEVWAGTQILTEQPNLASGKNNITDEEYINNLLPQVPSEHGENLECMVCHNSVSSLFCGVCRPCFEKWALSTKKSEQD